MSVGCRVRRSTLEPWADLVVQTIGADRTVICGSMRRGRPIVGDLDVVTSSPVEALETLAGVLPGLRKADPKHRDVHGVREALVFTAPGARHDTHLDVWHAVPEAMGAGVLYATGSGITNVVMRRWARRMGMHLVFSGLFRARTHELIAAATEEDVFRALGWDFLRPEDREHTSPLVEPYIEDLRDFDG